MRATLILIMYFGFYPISFGQNKTLDIGSMGVTLELQPNMNHEIKGDTLLILLNLNHDTVIVSNTYIDKTSFDRAFMHFTKDSLPKWYPNYKTISTSIDEINRYPYRSVSFKSTKNGIKSEHIIYMTRYKGDTYSFYTSNEPIYKYEKNVIEVLNSVHYPNTINSRPATKLDFVEHVQGKKWKQYYSILNGVRTAPYAENAAKTLFFSEDRISITAHDGKILVHTTYTYSEGNKTVFFNKNGKKIEIQFLWVTQSQLETREIDEYGGYTEEVYKLIN